MNELLSDCSGIEAVKTTFKYLNRHVNTSKIVDFRPELKDRTNAHDYFMPHHNNPYSSHYQTCFKNSLIQYQNKHDLSSTTSETHFQNYLRKEAKIEVIHRYSEFPDKTDDLASKTDLRGVKTDKFGGKTDKLGGKTDSFGGRIDRFSAKTINFGHKTVNDNVPPNDNVPHNDNDKADVDKYENVFRGRKAECDVVRRFKRTLQTLLDRTPNEKHFVILGDEHIYATDFAR